MTATDMLLEPAILSLDIQSKGFSVAAVQIKKFDVEWDRKTSDRCCNAWAGVRPSKVNDTRRLPRILQTARDYREVKRIGMLLRKENVAFIVDVRGEVKEDSMLIIVIQRATGSAQSLSPGRKVDFEIT